MYERKSTTVRSLHRPICLFIFLFLRFFLFFSFFIKFTIRILSFFSFFFLYIANLACTHIAPTLLMVVIDWLGWWWWVHIVWRQTDRDLLSLFFVSFGRFISSPASSLYRSTQQCIRVCALDLVWEHNAKGKERKREKEIDVFLSIID